MGGLCEHWNEYKIEWNKNVLKLECIYIYFLISNIGGWFMWALKWI